MPQYHIDHISTTFDHNEVLRKECPPSINVNTADPLWTRSLCPWYWKENADPKRIPAVLLEAECRCDKSVVALPGSLFKSVYECEKVYFKIRVLKLNEECGYYSTYEEISVACTTIVSAIYKAAKGRMINDEMPSIQV